MKINKLILALASTALIAAPAAHAMDLGNGVSFSGFGTLAANSNSTKGADFVSNSYFQPNGVGQTTSLSGNTDSKIGVQLGWRATDRLSFVGQAVSKQWENNSWMPRDEWAYADFAATPDIHVRAGRIRPAIYMLSDYLDANAANPWVRPPIEFYAMAPVTHITGGDIIWRKDLANISWLVQPYMGRSDTDLTNNTSSTVRNLKGINITGNQGDFTGRIGYVQANMSVFSPTMVSYFGMLNSNCTGGDTVACSQSAALVPTNKTGSFTSLGGSWDNGNYFASGEYGVRHTDFMLANATAWYLSGGARIDKFTPFVTYSSFHNDGQTSFTGGNTSTPTIVTGLLQSNQMNQHTLSLGVRYDLASHVDVKFQLDHIQTQCGVAGTCGGLFVSPGSSTPLSSTPFAATGQTVNVATISVDFTF